MPIEWFENTFREPVHYGGEEESDDEFKDSSSQKPFGMSKMGPMKIEGSHQRVFTAHSSNQVIARHIVEICKVPGVDVLEALSRYSFRIAIARLFSCDKVKREVEKIFNPASKRSRAEIIKESADRLFDHWSCYMDGDQVKIVSAESDEELKKKIEGRVSWP